MHPRRSATPRALRAALLTVFTFALCSGASAQQSDPDRRIGHTVLDESPEHYRFESFTVDSADAQRRWRVTLGIPHRPVPATGFPALWMLDGNAALMEFDAALLEELAAQPEPQVLVFVGYDNDRRIDPSRTRDYTFAADSRENADTPGERRGGGANAFLEIIERRIRPELARRVATDPGRQTLWGHSLAGLFALHTLYTRTGAFQTYAAGSPSLWWADGAMLGDPERHFIAHGAGHPARVLLSLGGGERARDTSHRDMSDPRVREHLRRTAAAPSDATANLAGRLRQVPGLEVDYREFPELTHGLTFRASLMATLHTVAGVADRSDTRGAIR
ncbi:alpha/beta hydrolase [Billgrantia endophytica]|uniref:Esterase n=1 Tax=Billgrantia endophytica TaxID=2033802 RepID=A0A2N7TXC8_9GAMM|nr:alpha/beta hydrolase-fold protein [Halomonas endophytica]PMR72831.1 esterase [Halomonas endophytica]